MLSRQECLDKYGSDYLIKKRLSEGTIFQVGKAVYSEEKQIPYIAVLLYKYPKAVVTMHNAFYIHGLTDVIPDLYSLATDRDSSKINDKNVIQYFIPSEIFKLGIEKIDYKGYEIPIYSKEKMLVELIRYKSKLPFDYYKEIISNYRKIIFDLNIQDIQDYALLSPKSNMILKTLQMEVF